MPYNVLIPVSGRVNDVANDPPISSKYMMLWNFWPLNYIKHMVERDILDTMWRGPGLSSHLLMVIKLFLGLIVQQRNKKLKLKNARPLKPTENATLKLVWIAWLVFTRILTKTD